MAGQRILIVDDEPNIVELLRMSMRRYGYQAVVATTGEEALQIARQSKPDLILLDIMLPGIDGLETCRRLRQDRLIGGVPIIMLTAKSEETDKIIGLGIGADDYVTKPFSVRELFARIGAVLRRKEHLVDGGSAGGGLLRVKDLDVDADRYCVSRNGKDLELTRSEFRIFLALARNQGRVVPRDKLITEVSGAGASEPRTLDVHIRNLRKKLDRGDGVPYITTMRGVGYKL